MKKCKITVYDYRHKPDSMPDKYEVEAWCVSGEEGIRALFQRGDVIYEAHGDDGHWWVVGGFNKWWLDKITKMHQAMADELKGK